MVNAMFARPEFVSVKLASLIETPAPEDVELLGDELLAGVLLDVEELLVDELLFDELELDELPPLLELLEFEPVELKLDEVELLLEFEFDELDEFEFVELLELPVFDVVLVGVLDELELVVEAPPLLDELLVEFELPVRDTNGGSKLPTIGTE